MFLQALAQAKGALMLLCCLGTIGPMTVNASVRQLRIGRDAVNHAIHVLESLGLCTSDRSDVFPFARTVSLTTRGRALLATPVGDLPGFAWNSARNEFRSRAGATTPRSRPGRAG